MWPLSIFFFLFSVGWLYFTSNKCSDRGQLINLDITEDAKVVTNGRKRRALTPCNFEMPKKGECYQEILWKAKNEDEALGICYDTFPTTFVTATFDKSKITCTIKAAYQCLDKDTFNIFDKCYKFTKDNGTFVTAKISEYTDPQKIESLCPNGGSISQFFSHNHIKHVARKASVLGVEKMWIGLTSDGKSLTTKMMIHKNLWNLVEGSFWNGSVVVEGNATLHGAEHVFLRTKTDYILQRMRGSYELATDHTKGTFACEYPAYFQTDQKWYCDKLGALGFDAVYDERDSRCLYLSTSKYKYGGDKDGKDLSKIRGCSEQPSKSHLVGMDDGKAQPELYKTFLKRNQKLRLAGVRTEHDYGGTEKIVHPRGTVITDSSVATLENLKWNLIEYPGETKKIFTSQLSWQEGYPVNEFSTFASESNTLGVENGALIDMPREAIARVICSIKISQECELKKPCGEMECVNTREFQKEFDGFFKCSCPIGHIAVEKQCKWDGADDQCAYVKFSDKLQEWANITKKLTDFEGKDRNDRLYEVSVRKGCEFTARSHYAKMKGESNIALVRNVGFGTHTVPNKHKNTLGGAWAGLSASSYECTCPNV